MRLATRSGSTFGLIAKLILLGLAVAIAIWGAIPLINAQNWIGLAILIVATVAMLYIYLTPKIDPGEVSVLRHDFPARSAGDARSSTR